MKAIIKKYLNSENKNYYIAVACILAIVIIVFIINNQNRNVASYATAQADLSGLAYAVADSPDSVAEIMAQQAAAGHMKKVYTYTPATAYAYLRND
jgi:hypothetical protein